MYGIARFASRGRKYGLDASRDSPMTALRWLDVSQRTRAVAYLSPHPKPRGISGRPSGEQPQRRAAKARHRMAQHSLDQLKELSDFRTHGVVHQRPRDSA